MLNRPELLDERLETISRQGFGDEHLDELAHVIVRLRIEADPFDAATLNEELHRRGMATLLQQIAWAAERSGAPFLAPGLQVEQMRTLWLRALDRSVRLQVLERAVAAAKADLRNANDLLGFKQLKSERDQLKRQVLVGEDELS